ncbi:MAG TPA: 4Fe-4S binding protein [Rectinemataceae bacterium]|nr:4Fe-4S binding protein [Rectinemataceae bacterium]
MPVIEVDKCTGCKICMTYCSVDAIEYQADAKKCFINPKTCTECYVCYRMKVCAQDAIVASPIEGFFKQFQHVISDPVENHGVTGVTGRGTEEAKTNDVSGRVKKGEVGFCIDMGRPGMGVYLRDAEKVAMACAAAGLAISPPEESPIGALMPDYRTGKMDPACLDYRLLSVIIEGKCKTAELKNVLIALKDVEKKIDTVFSLGLIVRVDEEGHTDALDCLKGLGIDYPHRGKVNVGLGRPLSLA